MKVRTHKPNSVVWIIALVLFIYALIAPYLPLPSYASIAIFISAALLLLGTTVF